MPSRRRFLQTTAGLALGHAIGSRFLPPGFPSVLAQDSQLTPDMVRLHPEVEPLVRLIEDPPRDRVFEAVADQLHSGVPYRTFLASLYLAGIRNVNPQPPGFKFHCVFVINAAHQISLDGPVGDRLLPLFQALDYFKDSQQRDVKEGDFQLRPVTGRLPVGEGVWREFHDAMNTWDEARADRAITALVRSRGAQEIIAGLWQYGARDYRNIGHKSIFVANTWRTLQTIGWQHAEPALRSLVLGLLDYGPDERVNEFAFEDQSWLPNIERVNAAKPTLHEAVRNRAANREATLDLRAALREASANDCCGKAAQMLAKGSISGQAAWDAVHLAAGELMMRQPGIFGIHTVTSSGGLRYAFEQSGSPQTRAMMLLQGIGWMAQFRHFMSTRRNGLNDADILQVADPGNLSGKDIGNGDISAQIGRDLGQAARSAAAYAAQHGPDIGAFRTAVAQSITNKNSDPHHYKYASAILEDYGRVSPIWRPHILATSVYYRPGDSTPDSDVTRNARALLNRRE